MAHKASILPGLGVQITGKNAMFGSSYNDKDKEQRQFD